MNDKDIIDDIYKNGRNIIIDGDQGVGKSTAAIYPLIEKIISNKENFFVIDNKEEYLARYQERLKKAGYNINIINLKDMNSSHSFNPLKLPYELYKTGRIEESIKLTEDFLLPYMDTNPNILNMCINLYVANNPDNINCLSLEESKKDGYLLLNNSLNLVNSNNFKYILNKHNIKTKGLTATFIIPNLVCDYNHYINTIIEQLTYLHILNDKKYNLILDNIEGLNIYNLEDYLLKGETKLRCFVITKSIETLTEEYGNLINHLSDYLLVSKEDIEYRISKRKGKLDRTWKMEEFPNTNIDYPETDKSTIKFYKPKNIEYL